jgi:hypothetical protein
MASLFPKLSVISKLKVPPTNGELYLCDYLNENLGEDYYVFFNPYLDGDRPDLVILKKNHGAIIIEVKDWDLSCYSINQNNQWSVEKSRVRSPFSQVFKYKSNFFDLHLPTLGLREALNKSFFRVISCYVYFHLGTKESIGYKYNSAISQVDNEINTNNENFKNKVIPHGLYEKRRVYFQNKKSQLNRDQRLSITKDRIDELLKKIKSIECNKNFSDDIYDEFIRRLMPPEHVLGQGIELNYDKKQLQLIESRDEFKKIKGVAGCGKTSIIAKRAVNAYIRHESPVLILTFNITLKHYIKDKISDVRRGVEFNNFEITNYHQFFNSQLNNLNIDISEFLEKQDNKGLSSDDILDLLYKTDFFKSEDVDKYQTIYIDEIQDYESEWVKIIKNNFLSQNGEMLLFGDQSQNIYERDINTRESPIVNGFGRWVKLTKSYRSDIDSPLVNLFKEFQKKYLIEKYQDSEVFDSNPNQGSINFDILKYLTWNASVEKLEPLFHEIIKHIKSNNIVPNDLVVLSSSIELLRNINLLFNVNEKTMVMFETNEEYKTVIGDTSSLSLQAIKEREKYNEKEIKKIRRRKKNFFMQNSGLIKLSTTHSFKGLESPTVFCILLKDDNPEIVYTALTRAKENLIIFDVEDSKYADFFNKNLV